MAQIAEKTGMSQREISAALSDALAELHGRLESVEEMRVA
jgi:DNA-binding phage protein